MTRCRGEVVVVLRRCGGTFAWLEVGNSSLKIHLDIFPFIVGLHFKFWLSVSWFRRLHFMGKSCSTTAAVRASVGNSVNS